MRLYNKWGGNPKGTPEDIERCIVQVVDSMGWASHQCYRKRGHGPDGLYCKQHGKKVECSGPDSVYIPRVHPAPGEE